MQSTIIVRTITIGKVTTKRVSVDHDYNDERDGMARAIATKVCELRNVGSFDARTPGILELVRETSSTFGNVMVFADGQDTAITAHVARKEA